MAWRTVTFNANGGTLHSTSPLYFDSSSGSWFTKTSSGTVVVKIGLPTRDGFAFKGFFSKKNADDAEYTSPSVTGTQFVKSDGSMLSVDPGGSTTIYAGWVTAGGGDPGGGDEPDTGETGVASGDDHFGLASPALVPISSETGDEYHREAVSHGGRYESGVNEGGGIWRNPTVTYAVVKDTTVAVRLGLAFPAVKSGTKMTRSGYMITSVQIVTEVGKFPTVTVSAVANEGANAVNNFAVNANRFNVSVPVVARSKAQNLLGAVSGGGHLQRVTLTAACTPVVCEENLMPCASDIVNGCYSLSAETVATGGEDAPTMAAASGTNGGFALVGAARAVRDCDFVRYTVEARREMT